MKKIKLGWKGGRIGVHGECVFFPAAVRIHTGRRSSRNGKNYPEIQKKLEIWHEKCLFSQIVASNQTPTFKQN